MKKLLLIMAVALTFGQLSAQKNAWRQVTQESVSQLQKFQTQTYSERQQLLQVNLDAVKQVLTGASDKFSGAAGVLVDIPNIEGEMERFQVWENSNFTPELQAQYPNIRAYVGKNMTDGSTIHFSVSPTGIQTMILRPDRSSEFIEPYTKDQSTYVLFDSKTRNRGSLPFNCSTDDVALNQEILEGTNPAGRSNTQSYKTMRLALSCTGEYAVFHGGTTAGALAAMNATMTRVNGVMEIDLAIHLNIIAGTTQVIYTNAGSDPYSTASVGTDPVNADNLQGWNLQLQNTLTSVLGNSAYDIGHLFGASGGGGNAGCIGCVCADDNAASNMDKNKGSGYTSPADGVPQGDTFDIDYVIHEMGHQMGANHTFSHNVEGSGVNVEPGSGSTIMGYAGITGSYDVQPHSDPYFVYRSILQIQNNMAGKTCPVSVTTTNTPPTVDAGENFSVPAGTAYILKGIATDVDGDTLSYCWEQNNSAGAASGGANSVCSGTKTNGPNYRSFNPKTVPDRYMPEYSKVLAGTLSTTWESVNTTVGRSLQFALTVRDNHIGGWQTNTDVVNVTSQPPYNGSTGVGPFAITSQNSTGTVWGAAGTTQTVTWSVNNTTSLPGSANINIKMSTDGGLTWPITLASNTPNDGSEDILVPAATSTNCRLKIEPTDHVYYAVNSAAFAVGYQAVVNCNTYTYNTPFTLPDGASSYTVKTVNVPTSGTISDVNIHVNATHPNIQNLTMAVIRPGNSTVNTYFTQQCANSANMDVTFDEQAGAFTCASPLTGTMKSSSGVLSNLNGFQQNGNWQFGFRDTVSGNSGTINSFWIEICSQTLAPLATEQFAFNNFALYPNPNNGSFKVQFDATSGKVNITVHDISGRRIFDKAFDSSGLFAQDIQLNSAQAGIYMVSITDGDQKIVKRIVVE